MCYMGVTFTLLMHGCYYIAVHGYWQYSISDVCQSVSFSCAAAVEALLKGVLLDLSLDRRVMASILEGRKISRCTCKPCIGVFGVMAFASVSVSLST